MPEDVIEGKDIEVKVDGEKMVEEIKAADKSPEIKVDNEPGFVKKRVERAERQTRENILSELGVESLEEIKERLSKVEEYQEKLDKMEQDRIRQKRVGEIKKRLEAENVFDPDVLIPFVNIDELEDTPESYDNEIEKLKEFKSNHFGVNRVVGDTHQPSHKEVKVDKIKEAESQGDYQAAIAEWIKLSNT